MVNLKRPWTAKDDVKLRALIDAGASAVLVAAKLRRTLSAVRSRSSQLQLSLARRAHQTSSGSLSK
jgi:hypothetical protein